MDKLQEFRTICQRIRLIDEGKEILSGKPPRDYLNRAVDYLSDGGPVEKDLCIIYCLVFEKVYTFQSQEKLYYQ